MLRAIKFASIDCRHIDLLSVHCRVCIHSLVVARAECIDVH